MENTPKNAGSPLSPEEIRAIGEIQIGPSKYESFLDDHYKKLILSLVALGLLGGAAIAWFSHKSAVDERAAARLIAAMGEGAVKSSAEPRTISLKDIQAAVGECEGTPSAPTARYLEGVARLAQGDQTQGTAILSELASSEESGDLIRQRSLASLAMFFMNAGEKEKAVEFWKKVCADESSLYAPLACMCLGDLAKMDGHVEDARGFYKTAVEKYPQSALVRQGGDIPLRLALLDVDEPKPVAPSILPSENFMETPAVLPAVDTVFGK